MKLQSHLPSWLGLLAVVSACGSDGTVGPGTGRITPPAAVIPVPWVDNAWVQPVPSWGSPVRLALPVPLDSIVLGPSGGLGFFGAHEGGHVEGLDHVWIPTKPGTVVGSWADGTVLNVQLIDGFYYIDIDYGHGLVGKHQLVVQPLVAAGQHVKQGDPVGTARLAEFNLVDYNRSDGVRTEDAGGANVSPFDYLEPNVQASLLARVTSEVVAPYFANGSAAGNSRPWEPYLTNKLLFHRDHRGTFQGERLLTNKGWTAADPLYFDLVAIHDVTNSYGHYPDSISSNAAVYIERTNVYLGLDAQQLGLLPK